MAYIKILHGYSGTLPVQLKSTTRPVKLSHKILTTSSTTTVPHSTAMTVRTVFSLLREMTIAMVITTARKIAANTICNGVNSVPGMVSAGGRKSLCVKKFGNSSENVMAALSFRFHRQSIRDGPTDGRPR